MFSSDIDPDARLIYAQNWGEEPAGDIGQVGVAEIPPHDVLCGGFPCQPFSISGNQGGFEDARGTLLHEILRIARHHQPSVLFLENVKNFLSHGGGETLAKTIELLNRVGVSGTLFPTQCFPLWSGSKEGTGLFCLFSKRARNRGFSIPRAKR